MDKNLAEIYGTNQVSDASDVEKLAAAAMAEELANDSGMDVNNLSDEQVEALAQKVVDNIDGESAEQQASADDTDDTQVTGDEPSEDDLKKVAEVDKLGRVMAHAMWQELGSISKEASAAQAVKNMGQLAAHGAKAGAGKVMGAVKNLGEKGKGLAAKGKEMAGKGMDAVKKNKVPLAVGAGSAAAGGAAGFMAGKSKKSSALDTLAARRAEEILAENGVKQEEQEKVSSADLLAKAVEERAVQMLEEAGYSFENTEEQK